MKVPVQKSSSRARVTFASALWKVRPSLANHKMSGKAQTAIPANAIQIDVSSADFL
jgi:hypothetical protein